MVVGPGWLMEETGGARRGKASHDADFLISHPTRCNYCLSLFPWCLEALRCLACSGIMQQPSSRASCNSARLCLVPLSSPQSVCLRTLMPRAAGSMSLDSPARGLRGNSTYPSSCCAGPAMRGSCASLQMSSSGGAAWCHPARAFATSRSSSPLHMQPRLFW